jgi:Protein of unknown function (DUF3223)
MAKFLLGNRTFKSKQEARSAIQNILYKDTRALEPGYPLGQPIPPGTHHDLLIDLVNIHSRREDIIGPGIKHFAIMRDSYGACCFYALGIDNYRRNFSYIQPFVSDTLHTEVMRKYSNPDKKQKLEFKFMNNTEVKCHINKKGCLGFVTRGNCHAHHKPAFKTLMLQWATSEGINDLTNIELTPRAAISFERFFLSNALAQSWIAWHQKHAEIYPTCAFCNLSMGSRDE